MVILRLIYLQALWFLFIYLGGYPYHYLSVFIGLFIIFIDYKKFYPQYDLKHFSLFIVLTLVLGTFLDSLLINLGYLSFSRWPYPISPPYMWAIWIIFVPYFQIAFNRFYDKKILAIALAAIFAPISYKGGSKIGDLEILDNGIYAIAVTWAIIFPILILMHKKFFNKAEQSHPQ